MTYKIIYNNSTGHEHIATNLYGRNVLNTPLLNKGTAFTSEERKELGLEGKLPNKVETIEEQTVRCKQQYDRYQQDLHKHIFLKNLHDKNEILFYRLVKDNLREMLPIIYTPLVGTAVQQFSHEFRQPKGVFLNYQNRDNIEEILQNRTHEDIKLIVITDGERVLGLGDQGVGAIDIPIAKLQLYTLGGGINPHHCLPIVLDLGTNNPDLLNDPLYLGWRHERISREEYDKFIDKLIQALKKNFKNIFLHWEDFGKNNARRILEKYKREICSFNDDIQGTAIVTLSALLTALREQKQTLSKQRIIIYGAGTAGVGIADFVANAIVAKENISLKEAYKQFWLFDKDGCIAEGMDNIVEFQKPYMRKEQEIAKASLLEAIDHIKPTILIGCSAQGGAFHQLVIEKICQYAASPIILPLSNPNQNSEANPEDLFIWSEGKAKIATGSPFPAVKYKGTVFDTAQCNNALAFPGIGLGIITCQATYVSEKMLFAASEAISEYTYNIDSGKKPLLPDISEAPKVAIRVAKEVIRVAIEEGISLKIKDPKEIDKKINEIFWTPFYRTICSLKN